ncbi:MAG: formate--tetrahydrofolate ligase [Planctomycetes bacterium]|nr:formate--tetrahydrofolate ligase [Planctomycetota bacterium]
MRMLSDIEIARQLKLTPITDVAAQFGVPTESVYAHGPTKAKIDYRTGLAARDAGRKPLRYVLVTAITPTPAGEGKTLHTIGLSLALNKLGKKAVCTLRQPSMGPVFGVKGGAAGGGHSQVVPMEDFNLHLTGDFHAVADANNLCAAALDTSILLDNPLKVDPAKVTWRRVVDVNDRALRQVRIGLGGSKNGVERETGFDITPASEVMAVLGMASDLADMRARLGRMVLGRNQSGKPVTAEDLGVAGAMSAILRDALHPTLMQTSEGTPALIHTGPFANIAHGNASIIADRVAARFADWVVTEAGFAADMGGEKFFDIKCRASGMKPDCALLVATVRALKVHSGRFTVKAGSPLPPELSREDLAALKEGCSNLEAQIANVRRFGVPVVVAVNRFPSDTAAEIALVRECALAAGADAACESRLHERGGAGGMELAEAVVKAAESGKAKLRFAYELGAPIRSKIESLARDVYGAGGIEIMPEAARGIDELEELGFGQLPICVAKTQYSLSHDAALRGRPTGFTFPVREVRLSAGAGFIVVMAGDIQTMPGLGRSPGYKRVDLDAEGRITGLF